MFSASLRLSKDTTYEEKSASVDEVIHDLGLTHVADTWVSIVQLYMCFSCMYVCMCVKACVYTCMYTCGHTHTHTHTF